MVSNCSPRSLHAAEAEQSGERNLFKSRHFDWGIVVLRARWRPRYNLGWRNLVETMAELDVCRSYKHHALGLAPCSRIRKAVEPLACEVRGSWRVDETYVKIKGRWVRVIY